MKKLLAAALLICMIFAMSVNVFAATINESSNPNTVNADITTTVNPTYLVTIPADVTVEFNALSTNFGEIKVDAAQIHPDKCIKVTIDTDNKLVNAIDNAKVIPYKVMDGEQEFTSGTYLAKDDSTSLAIVINQADWDSAFAGSYSDTVTFTVSYTDKVA